jgi:AcrR family transcriptional regulator
MRKRRGSYHHGNLHEALLDAAVRLIEQGGPEAFTVREAARMVGVDHRAAYKHFADREAVLAEVAEGGYRELVERARRELDREPADAPATRRLLAIARIYVTFATESPGRYRVMTGQRLNERPPAPPRFPALERALDAAFQVVADEIERGVEDETFAKIDPTEATLALWAAMHGFSSLVLMRRIRVRRDQLAAFAERAIGHTVRGLTRLAR